MEENRITIEPGKRSGQPCIREVLGWLATGVREDQILADYPELEAADFPAIFDYASRIGRRVAL